MIERVGLVMVGRDEAVTPQTRSVRRVTDALRDRAQVAWASRWPDRYEDWSKWNVQACIGAFGSWSYVDFLAYEGLGTVAIPKLVQRLRYIPLIDHIDPEEINLIDPPVLHRSWLLLPPPRSSVERGWVERLRRLEIQLGNLLDHPEGQTAGGFSRLLARYGLALRDSGRDRPKIVPIESIQSVSVAT